MRIDHMESGTSYRPRVSRESRRLLIAGAAAVAVLWLLASIRFEDQPALNPVPSVLGQLNSGAQFEALASEIDSLQGRLLPSLLLVDASSATLEESTRRVAALRWRDDVALLLLPTEPHSRPPARLDVRAADPATRLAVVRVPGQTAAIPLAPWTPRRADQPRYMTSSDVTPVGVSLRPSFVGTLVPTSAVEWPDTVWAVPSGTDLTAGSFLFTTTGEFVGLVIRRSDGLAVVPGAMVFAEADRLLNSQPRPAGTIAVEVQALTEGVAALTGATGGVVVTSIDSKGPAWSALMVGDVIEAVDGRDLMQRQQWDARMSRLTAGETLALRVRRQGEVRETSLEATALDGDSASGTLGLALRRRAGLGAEVTGVQPTSEAHHAGLSVGDVITLFGELQAPTPAQITRSFAALRPGQRLMVAVTRGEAHHVTVVGR
jgi:hypothetical protein